VTLILCNYCESSNCDVYNCPYLDYVDATSTKLEGTIKAMTDKIVEIMKERIAEYSHYFNPCRMDYNESDSSLGSPKLEVNFLMTLPY